jgi:hypothetical protein
MQAGQMTVGDGRSAGEGVCTGSAVSDAGGAIVAKGVAVATIRVAVASMTGAVVGGIFVTLTAAAANLPASGATGGPDGKNEPGSQAILRQTRKHANASGRAYTTATPDPRYHCAGHQLLLGDSEAIVSTQTMAKGLRLAQQALRERIILGHQIVVLFHGRVQMQNQGVVFHDLAAPPGDVHICAGLPDLGLQSC